MPIQCYFIRCNRYQERCETPSRYSFESANGLRTQSNWDPCLNSEICKLKALLYNHIFVTNVDLGFIKRYTLDMRFTIWSCWDRLTGPLNCMGKVIDKPPWNGRSAQYYLDTYRSPANSAKSSVRFRRRPPRKRLLFCQMICLHSCMCKRSMPRSSADRVFDLLPSAAVLVCVWSGRGWEPHSNLLAKLYQMNRTEVFLCKSGNCVVTVTYESGGGGGLSLITSNLSISRIVWRTVAALYES